MLTKTNAFSIVLCFAVSNSFSQIPAADSVQKTSQIGDVAFLKSKEQSYSFENGITFIYSKPKPFGFITNIPKDAAGIAAAPFKKKALKPLLAVAGSTFLLWVADEKINRGVHQFSKNINWHPEEEYKNVLNIKSGKTDISLIKVPKNINTALYQIGQGFPSLLISAGLFIDGKIRKDYRSLSTANQLAESFILMGVGTQLLKRIAGRQTPGESTSKRGEWNVLPSFKNYQTRTPYYDAFPSGHLATLMSTVTVLTENYPEKKWIKPLGYSVTGLVGMAMINNNVHWVSDYPLALGLGYLCAKQVVKHNRKTTKSTASFKSKHKGTFTYSFNYVNGSLMPDIIYKF